MFVDMYVILKETELAIVYFQILDIKHVRSNFKQIFPDTHIGHFSFISFQQIIKSHRSAGYTFQSSPLIVKSKITDENCLLKKLTDIKEC